jgi:hypothetical protein
LWTVPYITIFQEDEFDNVLEEYSLDIGASHICPGASDESAKNFEKKGHYIDDWGTNTELLINPKIWREMFKPLYKEYCDIIHNAGKFAFYHSDGHIEEIFGDFIEVGVDAINSQLFVMNIEKLAQKYKGKITLWGELDRQYIQPFGSLEDVRNAVARVRRAFDDDTGGVIAHCTWGRMIQLKILRKFIKLGMENCSFDLANKLLS